MEIIFAEYKDEGPGGPGPQCCELTNDRRELHIFLSWKDFQETRDKLLTSNRRNPRFDAVWVDDTEEVDSQVKWHFGPSTRQRMSVIYNVMYQIHRSFVAQIERDNFLSAERLARVKKFGKSKWAEE